MKPETLIYCIDDQTDKAIAETINRLVRCADAMRAGRFDAARHGGALSDLQVSAHGHLTMLKETRKLLHRWVDDVISSRVDELTNALQGTQQDRGALDEPIR